MNKQPTPIQDTKLQYPTVTPTVYVNENKDGYTITFEMPGVSRDDIDLNIENRTLTLRTKTSFTPPEGMRCECREFPICNYAVSLDLPEQADPTAVKASVTNGVMTARVAKRAELQPRRIAVGVD